MNNKEKIVQEQFKKIITRYISNVPDFDIDDLIEWCKQEEIYAAICDFEDYCEEIKFILN